MTNTVPDPSQDERGAQGNATSTSYEINLLHERRIRKAVEQDTLRLHNRVRQLQAEEKRAQKRVLETKQRLKGILEQRQRNEQREEERQQRLAEVLQHREQHREDILRLKAEGQAKKLGNEKKIISHKVTLAQQTKEERQEIEKLVAEERLLSRRRALEQKEKIRKEAAEAHLRSLKCRERKAQEASMDYNERLQEELLARAEKEKELRNLAEIELVLIDRLKEKQREQQQALQQLQAVLALGRKSSKQEKRGSTAQNLPAPLGVAPLEQAPALGDDFNDEQLAQAFAQYDPEGSGRIPTSSLNSLLLDLKLELQPHQLAEAVTQLDPGNAGQLEFGEFVLWWRG